MRHIITWAALALTACGVTPALAQTKALTLGNLKAPIAKASGKGEAKSIKDLWSQIEGLPAAAPSSTPSPTPTPEPATYWLDCAKEGEICTLPIIRSTQVRFGAAGKYAYRDVGNQVVCASGPFGGDPAPGVVKSCAYASATATPPELAITGKPNTARDRLGINVAGVDFFSGEQTFANQAMRLEWRDPNGGWGYLPASRIKAGVPASVDAGRPLLAYLTPPASAWRGEAPETRCTWTGTGSVGIGEASIIATGKHQITFRWPKTSTPAQTVNIAISATDAADPIRDIDCREPGDTGIYAAQLLDYLKPFGVLRFLDWSSANANPPSVTWATRGQAGTNTTPGSDGIALEYQIGLANAAKASPWFTVPLNADADYQRRMARMVHDQVPAGRPVYVELSNETWNYQFGQARQLENEGTAAKLSDNGFQSAQYRYAQRIIGMMAVWSEVYADRPRDLVRVVATQADNAWVGAILLDWNGGTLRNSIDAIAIAPYFSVDLSQPGDAVTRLSAAARAQIAGKASAYVALAKRVGKRVIAYEAGQHLVDPARVDLVKAVNRDPRMEGIYRQYLADWSVVSGDLMTLYAATGSISQYGAWGLREYAGQPLSETPKLRGVVGR